MLRQEPIITERREANTLALRTAQEVACNMNYIESQYTHYGFRQNNRNLPTGILRHTKANYMDISRRKLVLSMCLIVS